MALLGLSLTGCATNDALSEQANAGDQKNYIAGDGSILELAPDQRKEPLKFTATTFEGATVDGSSFMGKVTVMNFWYASCAPCRKEAPDLQAAYEDLSRKKPSGKEVEFLGVNVRDTQPTAEAFNRTFNITYPSLEDSSGQVLLALAGTVPPNAVPTTLVVDGQGRVAARVVGIVEKSTLTALVDKVAAE